MVSSLYSQICNTVFLHQDDVRLLGKSAHKMANQNQITGDSANDLAAEFN